MPVTARYRPDPLFAQLGPEFADPVAAAKKSCTETRDGP